MAKSYFIVKTEPNPIQSRYHLLKKMSFKTPNGFEERFYLKHTSIRISIKGARPRQTDKERKREFTSNIRIFIKRMIQTETEID